MQRALGCRRDDTRGSGGGIRPRKGAKIKSPRPDTPGPPDSPRAAAVPTYPTAMAEADLRSPRFAWLVLRRNDRVGWEAGWRYDWKSYPSRACQSYARE